MLSQIVGDGSLKLIDALEGATANAFAGNLREEAFDQVDPDEEVGVKCSLKRGCLASQACTSLVLWVL